MEIDRAKHPMAQQLKKIAYIGGPQTEKVLLNLSQGLNQSLFPLYTSDVLQNFDRLGKAFQDSPDWQDSEIALLLTSVFKEEALSNLTKLNFDGLVRFIGFHVNEPAKIMECLSVDPPSGHTILKMYSSAGSQKSVFLSKSDFYQKEIVLKVVKDRKDADDILSRESLANPLYLKHYHIIQTFVETNNRGQKFLLEQKMPFVLFDDWPSEGVQETANLILHIASALKFLHEKGYVHGDIKPDNIGRDGNNYVLMDFGLCRTTDAVKNEREHFGSLRTRAPELLIHGKTNDPDKIDIWALGATAFNAYSNRYPLYNDRTELPPRSSKPEERKIFEEMIRHRAINEWDKFVNLDSIKNGYLKDILAKMLTKDPAKRITAGELCKEITEKLSSFLRHSNEHQSLSDVQQLQNIIKYFPRNYDIKLIPQHTKEILRNHIFLDDSITKQILNRGEQKELKELKELFKENA